MVDSSIIGVLAILHILFAVLWFGGVVFFLSVLSPAARTFSPTASLELLTKAGPRQVRFFEVVATATILFGLALLFAYFGTDYSLWPSSIIIGFSLGLIAYLIAMFVTIPTIRKAVRIVRGMVNEAQRGPPPPELALLVRRGNRAAAFVTLLLLLTFIFMVGAAFPL